MAAAFGESVRITVFGQSHSEAIGCVIDGLPAGLKLDLEAIRQHMKRRAPGAGGDVGGAAAGLATARNEADEPQIVSGLVDGVTCGAPLCALIYNRDPRSRDYAELKVKPRPSHADYPAYMKYGVFHDIRGGGQFSGRLTAPLCFAGAVCMQYLAQFGIAVHAELVQVGTETDPDRMTQAVLEARAALDSVGGIVACRATDVPAGIGEPVYGALESRLASVLFAVPGVKGVEFGDGFALAAQRGSVVNDPYRYAEDGTVVTASNHNGGILGGISTGMPIVLRVAFKPTPSIAREQQTVNLETRCETTLEIKGRHDPCIAIRAVPVVESAVACVLADCIRRDGASGAVGHATARNKAGDKSSDTFGKDATEP